MGLIYDNDMTCPKCGSTDVKVTDMVEQGCNPPTFAVDLKCKECDNTATANMAVDTIEWDEDGTKDEEFKESLNDFCKDHYEHFECFPVEFEYNGKVHQWESYVDLIDFDGIKGKPSTECVDAEAGDKHNV
jgi:hypothetical protein